jgi:hypothetical protein
VSQKAKSQTISKEAKRHHSSHIPSLLNLLPISITFSFFGRHVLYLVLCVHNNAHCTRKRMWMPLGNGQKLPLIRYFPFNGFSIRHWGEIKIWSLSPQWLILTYACLQKLAIANSCPYISGIRPGSFFSWWNGILLGYS